MDITTPQTSVQQPSPAIDRLADGAASAIRSTQGATNAAFDCMNDKVEDFRDKASPMLDRLAMKIDAKSTRASDALREKAAELRAKANQTSDATIDYIRAEPVKAVLIAVATGAALLAFVNLLTRSRGNGY